MADNFSTIESSNSHNPFSFFRILYKNIILIILITVFCGLLGTTYSVLKVKPVYTASRSVMLRTSVNVKETHTEQGSVTLAKMYLPQVETAMRSPDVINAANELIESENQNGGKRSKLSAGAVSINYGTESLIFKVSYTSSSEKVAKENLATIIEVASNRLHGFLEADSVSLINVQNDADISVSSSFNKFVILGIALGVILAIGVVLIKHALDNTVKSKSEYEYLTGVSVIAVIDKIDEKNN